MVWFDLLPKAQAAENILPDQQVGAGLVTLRGNTRPEAKASNNRGRVSDDFILDHMMLLLQRTPAQEQALQQFIKDLHDPAAPLFHHWITAAEFGEKYGVASADISGVTDWLESQGFKVNLVYPNQIMIDFSGSAGHIRQAFHTEIHHLRVKGEDHIANMSDPQIPAELASTVAGIVSLNDFHPRPLLRPKPEYTWTDLSTSSTYYALVPADLWKIYNFSPAFSASHSGQGQTIVVVEDTDLYSTTDWTTFRSTLGVSTYSSGSLTTTHPGSCSDPGVTIDDGEAAVDVEWATAAAPSAAIQIAACASTTTFGGFIALQNLLNAGGSPPAIVSISYGTGESVLGAAFNASVKSLYQQAVTEGVSVFAGAGDSGAAGTDLGAQYASFGISISGFGSTSYNVSVGGTDFADTYQQVNSTYWNSTNAANYGSALSYIPEIPWNDSCGSVLIGDFLGLLPTYGANGLCNNTDVVGYPGLLTTGAGGGGPSGCATGAPDFLGAVSGTCAGYAKPSWQSGFIGNPADGVRDTPDVALFAGSGTWAHYYVVCYSDTANGGGACTGAPSGWFGVGGTSVATPIMAGIQALVNQVSLSRWGNPSAAYYALAKAEYGATGNASCASTKGASVASSCIFYDVTQIPLLYNYTGSGGDSDVPCYGMNCYAPDPNYYGVMSTSPQSLNDVMVTNLGSGYTSNPTCTLSGGGGLGGTCSAIMTGVVTGVNLGLGGSGYSTAVLCNLTGGGGTGASCAVTGLSLSGAVTGIVLTSYGTGYTSAPTCAIADSNGGIGSGATCTATRGPGISTSLTGSGSGYTTLPHCVISGGGGMDGACAALAVSTSGGYSPAYEAATGWDFTTGIGTVNASNLVSAFSTAAASLSTGTLTFPAQALNTTSTAQGVTLTNTGTSNLIILSDTISGTDAGDYAKSDDNCAGATVTPSHTCTVSVTFKPTADGTRTASLIFTDIAPHNPQTVELTGTGGTSSSSIAVSTVSPSAVTLDQGGGAQTVAVSLTRTNYTGSVTLSTSTLPSGVTATFTQPGTGTSGSIKLTPSSTATLVSGQTITITASGTGVTSATNTFSLTVTLAITVTLSPASASVALNNTHVFTATITNATGLNWYVNGVLNGSTAQGTISGCSGTTTVTCTYKAPPVNVPSPNPAVIKVASVTDSTRSKTASVTVTDSITVTLTPTTASVALSGTEVFTATITGATSNAVLNWYVNGVLNGSAAQGMLTACTTTAPLTCKYTAPPVDVPSPNPAVIKVASSADPGKNKTANLTVTDPIAVTLTPTTASVALSGTEVFTATITGATSNAVLNWYVNGVLNGSAAQGMLTACTTTAPLTCKYTAPPVDVPSPNPAVIKVASSADPGKNKTANLTVTDPIAVTLSPTSESLALGATQVFTATITGATSNAALNWYVNGVLKGNSTQGTLTACTTTAPLTCTYTAPPVDVPNPNPAVIKVASSADPGKNKTASVTVTDPIAVTLSPASQSLALGATQVFTATITGATSNAALNWYVNGVPKGNAAQGTLTACTTVAPLTCIYTAPPVDVPSPNPAVIKVASSADPGKNKTASVTVTDPIAVTLSPTSESLALSGTQVFTATITGATTNAVLNWYVNGVLKGSAAQGTLTACTTMAPLTCKYTAPPVDVPSPNPAVIKVASSADPGKNKTANLTVTDPIAVTLSPTSESLALGATQVFTATITGTTNTALDWYVNGVKNGSAAEGTLTACTTTAPLTCKYTAPAATVPNPNPAVIKVASVADPSKSATSSVTVQ